MQHTFKKTLSVLAFGLVSSAAFAQMTVGVSWSNFQEERWKTDEAAIKAQLEKAGAKYISADAAGSPEKQLGDMTGLRVRIAHSGETGAVTLSYASLDQLDLICQRLSGEAI